MNIRLLSQCVMQAAGLSYGVIKYRNKDIDSVDRYTPKVDYTLPFNGEWYIADGGVTQNISHSWEILPQRFAYDFFIVDEEGQSYHGDKNDLHSYYCYGKDILAPADGVVVSVKNNFPDCRIMSDGQPDPDTPDIGGNRVIIRHASGEYSASCHLMSGSVTVKKGQEVKRGEVIARCGNSGNTTEPHLHFQLQNKARFYSCIGVPILFSGIEKRMYPKGSVIDELPVPEQEDVREGYLHRCLLVRNSENK